MGSQNFVVTESEGIKSVLLKIFTSQRDVHILKTDYYCEAVH